MKAISFLLISIVLVAFWGCEPVADGLLPNDQPVVEAYLVAGQPFTLRVTKQIPFDADTTRQGQPIDGLSITIKSGDQTIPLTSEGQGYYISNQKTVAKVGKTYDLAFNYLGQQISASTIIPPKPVNFTQDRTEVQRTAITVGAGPGQGGFGPGSLGTQDPPVHLTWSNSTGEYHFVIFDNIEDNPVPIINAQANNNNGLPQGPGLLNRRIRNEPTQADNNDIQAQSFQYFGNHRIVLFRLNPDYAALYKQTSTSTQNISTPPTTITNGLGIFTGLNADTLYVNVVPK